MNDTIAGEPRSPATPPRSGPPSPTCPAPTGSCCSRTWRTTWRRWPPRPAGRCPSAWAGPRRTPPSCAPRPACPPRAPGRRPASGVAAGRVPGRTPPGRALGGRPGPSDRPGRAGFLPELRPAWWVLRGYLAVQAVAVPPRCCSPAPAWLPLPPGHRPRLLDHAGADVLVGLPHPDGRPARVGDHGQRARRPQGRRGHQHLPAGGGSLRHDLLGAVGGDPDVPVAGDALGGHLGRQRPARGRVPPIQPEEPVDPLTARHRRVLGLPAEQPGVEAGGGVEVGADEVDPVDRARRVRVHVRHGRPSLSMVAKG